MPFEWMRILQAERPLATYKELAYELTVRDVYNILEQMEVERFYNIERTRIENDMRK